MKVRYLDIDMKDGMGGEDRHTLLPIGYAILDRGARTVKAPALRAADCATSPAYRHQPLTAEHARAFDEHWSARGGEARLTLSEEELVVRKRERAAGAVEVEKHVDTERVSRAIPLTHEEVVVERHAVSGAAAAPGSIGAEELRVPLMAEEAVVEKRVVPKEEVVVRTREVTENEVVEATLRREHAEVHRDGAPGPADGER